MKKEKKEKKSKKESSSDDHIDTGLHIKPEATKPVDTSEWPLLLKVSTHDTQEAQVTRDTLGAEGARTRQSESERGE